MKIGDLLYCPNEKIFGVVLTVKDGFVDYCWFLKNQILMKEGFYYDNIIGYWQAAQKLKPR